MSGNKKGKIGKLALDLSGQVLSDIDSGKYDCLLNMNMDSIVKSFNSGDYSVLDNPDINNFLKLEITPMEIIGYILSARSLLQFKNDFYGDIIRQQDGMVYNPDALYHREYHSYLSRYSVTYAKTEEIFKLAERTLSSNRIYALLNFLLKYESLKESIATRKRLFKVIEQCPNNSHKLAEVLDNYDPEVGIIKIVVDGEIGVRVGTKLDMKISDVISSPFPADCEERGYYYGSHDDYYQPSHRVTKEFIPNGVTENHRKAIEAEKKYRTRLSQSTLDIKGFILYKQYAVIISSLELTRLGIDPERVGWQPLSLKIQPQNLFKLFNKNDTTKNLPISTKVQIQKDVILSKIQH